MAYPVPVVEIAFSDGPYVVSPTWTDVTAYVTDLSTSRGRDDDWGRFTGTAQVTLLNNDRRFDPFYTSGPYYGNLKPRRQIRIRSTWNGNTYDVFRGFIQGWPPAWTDAGKMSTVTLSCFDALDLLGSNTMPVDWAHDYVTSLGPYHYWRCNEPIIPFGTSTVIADYGSNPMPFAVAANCQQGSQIAPGLPNESLEVTGTGFSYTTNTVPYGASSPMTLSGWVNPSASDSSGLFYFKTLGWRIGAYLSNGYLYAFASQTGAALPTEYRAQSTTQIVSPSSSFMVSVGWIPATTSFGLFVNGVQIAITQTTAAGVFENNQEQITLNPGQFEQILVFGYILSQAQIQEIYRRSVAQFPETTSARVTRVIGETPFSTSLVSTPGSPSSSVLNIGTGAPSATQELMRTGDSEYAPLFVSRNGTITLFSQNQIRSQSSSITSQATFGAGGQPIGPTIELQYDGDSVRNVANVWMSGDGITRVRNESSVATFGQSESTVETDVSTIANATQIGNIVSGWGGQAYPTAGEVQVVMTPASTWSSVLNLELCDRFTLAVQPPSGNAITVPMLLSRVRHEARPGSWRTYVTGSARWAAVFILNQSVLNGTDLLG